MARGRRRGEKSRVEVGTFVLRGQIGQVKQPSHIPLGLPERPVNRLVKRGSLSRFVVQIAIPGNLSKSRLKYSDIFLNNWMPGCRDVIFLSYLSLATYCRRIHDRKNLSMCSQSRHFLTGHVLPIHATE